jgi:hypothetical protein
MEFKTEIKILLISSEETGQTREKHFRKRNRLIMEFFGRLWRYS